ncbi:hypothetical protein GURKE_04100 [Brevundimonas phage vB_BpoS-Gurke]|uniref:Uncharacterized protein n=1 Tax=Brevundimonas phage vB_BpoS-Gurke TaxID=2948599 RepID=A0A9E7N4M1_9CAUD|nr:hypothetical protein GURKE_04100 [Brevundimonas phage vB_BpoS-Gurke]
MAITRKINLLARVKSAPGDPLPRRITGGMSGAGAQGRALPLQLFYSGGTLVAGSAMGAPVGEVYASIPEAALSLTDTAGGLLALTGSRIVAGGTAADAPGPISFTVRAVYGGETIEATFTTAVVPAAELTEPTTAEDVEPSFKTPDGYLTHGSGNPVGGMMTATNGEIELAAEARYPNDLTVVQPVEGVYALPQAAGRDWIIPFSFGLTDKTSGKVLTDLYFITMTVTGKAPESDLVLTLRTDAAGKVHLENPAEGIDITDGTTDGYVYQNIQRLSFYRKGFSGGDFTVTLKAETRTRTSPLVELSFTVEA